MDAYQISALKQGSILIIIMIGASLIYYFSSTNEKLYQRILVSAYPMIFVSGELFALIGSAYYDRNSRFSGAFEYTKVGDVYVLILNLIFIIGGLFSLYTFSSFKGDRLTQYLAIPVYLAAIGLWFISKMTLIRDWL